MFGQQPLVVPAAAKAAAPVVVPSPPLAVAQPLVVPVKAAAAPVVPAPVQYWEAVPSPSPPRKSLAAVPVDDDVVAVAVTAAAPVATVVAPEAAQPETLSNRAASVDRFLMRNGVGR